MQPLVSICCITYNQVNLIKEAIGSFLMQKTNFFFEIIINDDASTDGTTELLKNYETKYPDLIFPIYHKENEFSQGIGGIVVRNAFPRARGKYIALCEGDDYWTDPLKLQKQVDFLEKNVQYSMVCHNAVVINETENSSRLFFSLNKNHTFSTVNTLNTHFCPTASILFRKLPRLLLDQFPVKNGAGDQMLVQLISLTGLIYRMDDVMSVYRIHSQGVTQQKKKTLIQVLENRKSDLWIFNKISNKKFQTNILIEIFLINRRLRYLQNPSKVNSLALKISRRIAGKIKRVYNSI